MAQILVRNLDDRLKARLQKRAKRNGHSMEAEVREILRGALREEPAPKRKLGSEMVALFSGSGICVEEGQEFPTTHFIPQVPDFDSFPEPKSWTCPTGA